MEFIVDWGWLVPLAGLAIFVVLWLLGAFDGKGRGRH